MATSYTNPDGSGDRRSRISVVADFASGTDLSNWVDGNTADFNRWFSSSTTYIEFWFPSRKIIDEAKFYQSDTTTTHGTWKWQGSNDHATWTDIGGSFTLGGASPQIHTSLNGNVTGYIFYRLLLVSGSASSGPFIHEFEFRIDDVGLASYTHALSKGNRTASIVLTTGGGLVWANGSSSDLIDGSTSFAAWWNADVNAGAWVKFDFATALIMQSARLLLATPSTTHGDWKWQGSNNDSTWTDVSPTFTILSQSTSWAVLSGFTTNVTAYRYYRMLGVAGSRTTSGFEVEFEFMLGAPAATTAEGRVSQLPVEVIVQSDAPIFARVSQLPIEIVVGVAPTITEKSDFFLIVS